MKKFSSDVVVPDRYEALVERAGDDLNEIIVEVPSALQFIDQTINRMRTAGRGAFAVFRGDSGSGKSTFLHTLRFFVEDIAAVSVPSGVSIKSFLEGNVTDDKITLFVLEEREAALDFADSELERWLHEVNSFLRSRVGRSSIVIWPCNTDSLRDRVMSLATEIGGKALVGPDKEVFNFMGPRKDQYAEIASTTLAHTNSGASFSDLGISVAQVEQRAEQNEVIGDFFSDIHTDIINAQTEVSRLTKREKCHLWIVVLAGTEPEGEVDGLTRTDRGAIDIEKLMSATEANVVADLKRRPEKIGAVGSVLDAKIFHMPLLAANAVVRAYADDHLRPLLAKEAFAVSIKSKSDAQERIKKSGLGTILGGKPLSVMSTGSKPGTESKAAFEKLTRIASSNDAALNRCFGRALVDAGLIEEFTVEQDFGSGMTRKTDLLGKRGDEIYRIEMMWRRKTGRAEIANYVLTKVYNYARAIEYIA